MTSSSVPGPSDLRAVLAAWGLDAARVTRLDVPAGDRWRVEGAPLPLDQALILRRYDEAQPVEAIRYEHDLRRFLDERSWPVAVPLATPEGETLVEALGARWSLSPVLPGAVPPDESIYLQRRGALLSLVHADLATWDRPPPRERAVRIDDFDAVVQPYGLSSFEALLARVQAVDGRRANALAVLRARIEEQLEAFGYVDLPAVPLWGACLAEHVLFDADDAAGDSVTGMLGFDDARVDVRAVDIATSLLVDARSIGWRIIRWVAGYSAHAEPPLREQEADLVPVLMAAIMLRRSARAIAEAHAAGAIDATALDTVEETMAIESHETDLRQVIRTAARLAPVEHSS